MLRIVMGSSEERMKFAPSPERVIVANASGYPLAGCSPDEPSFRFPEWEKYRKA